jgi:hypothetical protein
MLSSVMNCCDLWCSSDFTVTCFQQHACGVYALSGCYDAHVMTQVRTTHGRVRAITSGTKHISHFFIFHVTLPPPCFNLRLLPFD